MKRCYFALLFLICSSVYAHSAKQITIFGTNGSQSHYSLNESTKILFNDTDIIVCENNIEFHHSLDETSQYVFEELETTHLDMTLSYVSVSMINNNLIISFVGCNNVIRLFTIEGRILEEINVSHSGEYVYSLGEYANGSYILNINESSYKVYKK